MKIVRWFLSGLVLFVNFITWPKAGKRSPEHQSEVGAIIKQYSLYQFNACPFCVKVRRTMRRLNLTIELRDAKLDGPFRSELQQQGGKIKVPCLRIDHPDGKTEWMYESGDIVAFLEEKFPVEV